MSFTTVNLLSNAQLHLANNRPAYRTQEYADYMAATDILNTAKNDCKVSVVVYQREQVA